MTGAQDKPKSDRSGPAPATGSIAEALAHAAQLLNGNARAALLQADEILAASPGHPQALLIRASALRRLDLLEPARAILQPLAQSQGRAPAVHHELARTLAAGGDLAGAAEALRHAVRLQPKLHEAWRELGDILTLLEHQGEAQAAYTQAIAASVHNPALMQAAADMVGGELARAEARLRDYLRHAPTDPAAIRMLAEIGTRLGQNRDAEALLRRCLELAPNLRAARHNLAIVLFRQNRAADAIPLLLQLLRDTPADPALRNLLAACRAMIGDSAGAVGEYRKITRYFSNVAKFWLSFGHALRAEGLREESVAAYRRAIALNPALGEAYWSLANLKTGTLDQADLAAMKAQLARTDISEEDRYHLHYALGRAHEDGRDFAQSFSHYQQGAAGRRALIAYDPQETRDFVQRACALFTSGFYQARQGWGCDDPAPIFILGLPRSGSTLIEQILASHSAVEGTIEQPEVPLLARDIGQAPGARYPEALAAMDQARLCALGAQLVARARPYRKLGRAFYIDKLPNNWMHAGMIALILPNAKIIDARRGAMAACLSTFTQHFARGQHFSYDLDELGQYYRDYLAMMHHLDEVLPGRVHRVRYETMVSDTEGEIRRLLAYCQLDFEPACLRFWETSRTVRTASSEQVRQPIFTAGLDHWRNFQPWLGRLHQALGAAAES